MTQVTGGNWATSSDAEVDGIVSSRWSWDMSDQTVYVRLMFNVIQDHPVEPEKCVFCSRPDLVTTNTGMHVLPMARDQLAEKPFSWLA